MNANELQIIEDTILSFYRQQQQPQQQEQNDFLTEIQMNRNAW
jgi:hypothetical protein